MMVDELGLDKWDPQDLKGMWKQGAITMCSFWFFGGIPVITYAAISAAGVGSQNLIFLIDCIVTRFSPCSCSARPKPRYMVHYIARRNVAPRSLTRSSRAHSAHRQVTNTSMFIQGGVMVIN